MQTVRVQTPGCEQASCALSNDRGSWRLDSTPGTVTVTTSEVPLKVVCRTGGGVQGSSATPSALGAPSGVGAVAGGVVGGTSIGAAVGATAAVVNPVAGLFVVLGGATMGAVAGQTVESRAQALRYPELITLPMNCAAVGALAPRAGAAIGLVVRGLLRAEAGALGLGERSAVLVTAVAEGGAAAAAGLRGGDVLLAAMGRDLNDAADLDAQLSALPPGASLALRVWRDARVLELVLRRQGGLP